jgi:phospholipid transport system substrate-binding protein
MRTLFSALLLALLLLPAALPAFAQEAEVRSLLEQRDRDVKAVIGTRTTFTDEQRDQLKNLINDAIDFRAMSAHALDNEWNRLSSSEKRDFVDLFSQVVRNQSLANLAIYRADVRYDDVRVEGDEATVLTTTTLDGKSSQVAYELERRSGEWRIVDIILDDVSTVGSYERQFKRVFARRGYDGLMETLQKRLDREG